MAVENEDKETIEYYIQSWRAALRHINQWSPIEIDQWIQRLLTHFEGRALALLHEPPMYYIASALIPASLQQDLSGAEIVRLHKELQGALEDGDSCREFAADHAFDNSQRTIADIIGRELSKRSNHSG